MEKFSQWRDPATGIAPFLPPVPTGEPESIFVVFLRPFIWSLAFSRTLAVFLILVLHFLFVDAFGLVLVIVVEVLKTENR
jgi:hypothetical protein